MIPYLLNINRREIHFYVFTWSFWKVMSLYNREREEHMNRTTTFTQIRMNEKKNTNIIPCNTPPPPLLPHQKKKTQEKPPKNTKKLFAVCTKTYFNPWEDITVSIELNYTYFMSRFVRFFSLTFYPYSVYLCIVYFKFNSFHVFFKHNIDILQAPPLSSYMSILGSEQCSNNNNYITILSSQ